MARTPVTGTREETVMLNDYQVEQLAIEWIRHYAYNKGLFPRFTTKGTLASFQNAFLGEDGKIHVITNFVSNGNGVSEVLVEEPTEDQLTWLKFYDMVKP